MNEYFILISDATSCEKLHQQHDVDLFILQENIGLHEKIRLRPVSWISTTTGYDCIYLCLINYFVNVNCELFSNFVLKIYGN